MDKVLLLVLDFIKFLFIFSDKGFISQTNIVEKSWIVPQIKQLPQKNTKIRKIKVNIRCAEFKIAIIMCSYHSLFVSWPDFCPAQSATW